MKIIEQLNELIQRAINDSAFPGANYVIVTNDHYYYGSLGNKALYPEIEPNQIDTIYDMASLTKVIVTTSCIMNLVELGLIRLHDKVVTYLPEFKHKEVVIWDLLTHTSGLPADIRRAKDLQSFDETWLRIFQKELIYETNTKILYSDIGFILLGAIIEKITENSLSDYASKILFTPLKMNDTGFNPSNIKRCAPTERRNDLVYRGIIRGNVHDEKAYILGGVAGHAGLFSTVKDVGNFIRMFLNDGMFEGKKIFSKPTIDLLFKAQVEENHPLVLNKERRGLGWIIKGEYSSAGDLTSSNTILHTGFTGTNMWIDHDNKIGFCLLTNRVHPTRENLKIIDIRPKIANFIMANLKYFKKGAE